MDQGDLREKLGLITDTVQIVIWVVGGIAALLTLSSGVTSLLPDMGDSSAGWPAFESFSAYVDSTGIFYQWLFFTFASVFVFAAVMAGCVYVVDAVLPVRFELACFVAALFVLVCLFLNVALSELFFGIGRGIAPVAYGDAWALFAGHFLTFPEINAETSDTPFDFIERAPTAVGIIAVISIAVAWITAILSVLAGFGALDDDDEEGCGAFFGLMLLSVFLFFLGPYILAALLIILVGLVAVPFYIVFAGGDGGHNVPYYVAFLVGFFYAVHYTLSSERDGGWLFCFAYVVMAAILFWIETTSAPAAAVS